MQDFNPSDSNTVPHIVGSIHLDARKATFCVNWALVWLETTVEAVSLSTWHQYCLSDLVHAFCPCSWVYQNVHECGTL